MNQPSDYEPAPEQLNYRPQLNWRPMRPNPTMWMYGYEPPLTLDRTLDRTINNLLPAVILNQGAEGSCTANSMVNGLYAAARTAGLNHPLTCRMLDYYLSRVKEGSFPQDVGAGTDDSAGVVLDNGGLPAETAWAYSGNPAERPPASLATAPKYLAISQFQPIAASNWLDGALAALDAGQPVLVAMAWYEHWFADYQNTGVLSAPGGQLAGYHQVVLGGSIGKQQQFRNRNSWGNTSPKRSDLLPDSVAGDFYMPWSFLSNGVVQELCVLIPAAGPAPSPTPTPTPLTVSITGPTALAPMQTASYSLVASGGSSSAAPQYRCDWGDGAMSTWSPNNTPSHAYTRAGQFTITALAFDPATGTISAPTKLNVTVTAQPVPPTPSPLSPVLRQALDVVANRWPQERGG